MSDDGRLLNMRERLAAQRAHPQPHDDEADEDDLLVGDPFHETEAQLLDAPPDTMPAPPSEPPLPARPATERSEPQSIESFEGGPPPSPDDAASSGPLASEAAPPPPTGVGTEPPVTPDVSERQPTELSSRPPAPIPPDGPVMPPPPAQDAEADYGASPFDDDDEMLEGERHRLASGGGDPWLYDPAAAPPTPATGIMGVLKVKDWLSRGARRWQKRAHEHPDRGENDANDTPDDEDPRKRVKLAIMGVVAVAVLAVIVISAGHKAPSPGQHARVRVEHHGGTSGKRTSSVSRATFRTRVNSTCRAGHLDSNRQNAHRAPRRLRHVSAALDALNGTAGERSGARMLARALDSEAATLEQIVGGPVAGYSRPSASREETGILARRVRRAGLAEQQIAERAGLRACIAKPPGLAAMGVRSRSHARPRHRAATTRHRSRHPAQPHLRSGARSTSRPAPKRTVKQAATPVPGSAPEPPPGSTSEPSPQPQPASEPPSATPAPRPSNHRGAPPCIPGEPGC